MAVRFGALSPGEPVLRVFSTRAQTGEAPDDVPIVDVCRATTSAPTYFKPQLVGGKTYSDAGPGVGHNNPTMAATNQAACHFPGSWGSLCAVVSIGTGHKIAREEGTKKMYLKSILDGVKKQVLNTTQAHTSNDAREFFQRKPNGLSHYFRFDPPISGYKLDDYGKMPEMVAEVKLWLKLPEVRDQIVRAARLLSGADGRLLENWTLL